MKNLRTLDRLTEKHRRMIFDPNYVDVTPQDVKKLMARLKQVQRHDLAATVREKYCELVDDKEKQFVTSIGVDPHGHKIVEDNGTFYIDGFTGIQWRLLNDPDFKPSFQCVATSIGRLHKSGMHKEAEQIHKKYQYMFDAMAQRILQKKSIPSNLEYQKVTSHGIDNISFGEWRALNDPDYVPSKTFLAVLVAKFSQQGDLERVAFLCDKYAFLIKKVENLDEPELSTEEANEIFAALLGQ